MKIIRSLRHAIVASVAMVLGAAGALAQSSEPAPEPGITGTEYYVAFMKNEDGRGAATRFMGLMITSEVATVGEVNIPGVGIKPFATQPGQITTIPVPRTLEMLYGEEPAMPAVHITSRAPVAVYVLNALYQSSAGYPAVPTTLWRSTYLPMTLPNADGERVSEFMIIAAHDTTLVTINPSAKTNFRDIGQDLTVVLHKGQSYLVQARPGIPGIADLSASEIRASKPIGVVSGHMRTPITPNHTVPTDMWASHQAMMLLPDVLWGKEYITLPTRQVSDRFRMTSAYDGTTVEITHFPAGKSPERKTVTLNRGQIYDSAVINGRPITGPVHWVASRPIILMQMRTSGAYGDAANSPAMFPVTPLEKLSSHAPFAAPAIIGNEPLTQQTLTILAKGPASISDTDPENPLRSLVLDGTPVHTLAPEILTQKIGETEYYVVRVNISGGGHVLRSAEGYPFTAYLTGHNGSLGDFYTWTIPFWIPQVEADRQAPRLEEVLSRQGEYVSVRLTDKTSSYFSGIWDVKVVRDSKWQMIGTFTPPYPDENIDLTFRATSDPSGPLYVALRDRDGNIDTVMLSAGYCSQTAYADRAKLILASRNGSSHRDSMLVNANPCGDAAEVRSINPGNGNARNYLTFSFDGQSGLPFTIPGSGSAWLHVTVSPEAPAGTYTTEITIELNTGRIVLPVELKVDAKGGVDNDLVAKSVGGMQILPNPFAGSARIAFGRPLPRSMTIAISDRLGSIVRTIDGESLAGLSTVTWDGADNNGAPAPAGIYFIAITDGAGRSVRSATLLR